MDGLVKAAVSEISRLFPATLHLQITLSLKEKEAQRTRMEEMRRELKEEQDGGDEEGAEGEGGAGWSR